MSKTSSHAKLAALDAYCKANKFGKYNPKRKEKDKDYEK